VKGAVSHSVLAEAEGNILANLPLPGRTRYRQEILFIPLVVAPAPSTPEQEAVWHLSRERKTHMSWLRP